MKRRYKLLFIIVISFLFVIIIYFIFHNQNKYVYSIKEKNTNYSYDDFFKNDYIVNKYDKTNIMLNNLLKDLDNSNVASLIKESQIVIINFGNSELNNYLNLSNDIIIDYLNNAYLIFSKIRSINNKKIVFINLNSDEFFFINNKLKKYCKEFNIFYIDGTNLIKYMINLNNKIYLTYEGEKYLYKQIVNS